MTEPIHPHQADGRKLTLTAVHTVGGELLANIMTLRWLDEFGTEGQSSRVRLVKHIEQGGRLCIEHDGATAEVDVMHLDGSAYLKTREFASELDPLLRLPRF